MLITHHFSGFPESGRNPPGSWLGESNFNHNTVSGSSFWPGSHHLATNNISMPDHKLYVEQPTISDFITKEAQVGLHDVSDAVTCGDKLINDRDVQAVGEFPEKLNQVCYAEYIGHLHYSIGS